MKPEIEEPYLRGGDSAAGIVSIQENGMLFSTNVWLSEYSDIAKLAPKKWIQRRLKKQQRWIDFFPSDKCLESSGNQSKVE